jgi:hypothetical protein
VRCFVCGGPFHLATGGFHDNGRGGLTPFCGPCERDLVEWRAHVTRYRNRKIKVDGKTLVLRFYDYARPVPAVSP